MTNKTLTTKQLIKDSNCTLKFFAFTIFFLSGFLAAILPFLFDLTKKNFIISEIFLFTVFTIPFSFCIGLRLLIKTLKQYKALKLGNFLILLDKILYIRDAFNSVDTPLNEKRSYISLEKYTKNTNERIGMYTYELDGVKEGDKCILIFSQNHSYPFLVYPGKDIIIDESLQKNIVDITEFLTQVESKEKNKKTSEAASVPRTLTIKALLNDAIDKSQKLTTLFISLLVFVLAVSIILILTSDSIEFSFIVYFLLFLILLFLIIWDVLKIKYLLKIKKHIKEKKFSLKRDVVIQEKINQAHGANALKFKNYKKNVYFDETTDEYYNTKIGDEFYMLFVKGESEPIKIYNAKYVIISDELYDYLK